MKYDLFSFMFANVLFFREYAKYKIVFNMH